MKTVAADVRPAKIDDAPSHQNLTDARATLASWRDYRDMKPFASADSGFATDRCNALLSDAGSILSMLSAACEDAQSLLNKGESSEFDNRSGSIMAGALEGVGSLIDLAAFMMGGE